MKLYKSIALASLAATLSLTTGCSDDFAELNQNKTSVTVGVPSYLMAQAVLDFEPSEYAYWFYNAPMFQKWTQMGIPSGGFTAQYTEMTATGGQGEQYITVLKYRNDINNMIANGGAEAEKYKAYASVCDVLSIYLGIFDTDIFGDRPYTEAANAKFGGTITPKYDKVKDLYDLWLTDLDKAISIFTTSEGQELANQGTQDVIYKGKLDKWARLANSLKLKIAVRLINEDKAAAIKIAEEVANASCGYLNSKDDDMVFAKGTAVSSTDKDGDNVYHFNNNVMTSMAATKPVMDFMLNNKDPRVRFNYKKDGFNSTIVQGFIDDNRFDQLPTYVKNNVILDEDGNFKAWGGMGEPWVRYAGLPIAYEKNNDPEYAEYFNPGTRFNLTKNEATKSYTQYSGFQQEMLRGRVDFTLPTLPGDAVIQDTDDNAWYGMYMTSAEVNLYLAEFKLLGANLPQTADYYYNKGVESSVEVYDRVAGLNKIPYYGTTYDYDQNEKSIELKSGEIEAMMASEDVKLTGTTAEKIEKVYLQELLHFIMFPSDQFVTARRSGYPMKGSKLIPFTEFTGEVNTIGIPRRFEFTDPSKTNQMYDILVKSYKSQGFTTGSSQSGGAYNVSGTVLNTERVWQDQKAPQWGEGCLND